MAIFLKLCMAIFLMDYVEKNAQEGPFRLDFGSIRALK
jgi:hypothetical protein